MEEVVWWLVKPLATMPVPVGLEAKGVAVGALIEEVVEGVCGPAASAGKLVLGDVRPEPVRVVRGEGVAHCKAEGSGGGVSGVHGQGFAHLGVRVRADSLLPEGVIVAVGGFGDRVSVHKGGIGVGASSYGPLGGPSGESALPGDGLTIGRRLNTVEGGARGDAAGSEGLEAGRRVCRAIKDCRGPHRRETEGRVAGDEGCAAGPKASPKHVIITN